VTGLHTGARWARVDPRRGPCTLIEMVGETMPVAAGVSPNEAPPLDSDASPAAGASSRPSWRHVAAVLVLVGGLGLVVPEVVHSLRSTAALSSGSNISIANAYYGQLNCYRGTIERQVPKDARVYLGSTSSDEQLLVEASEMWATILPTPAGAQYRISIDHGHGSCNGSHLMVRRS